MSIFYIILLCACYLLSVESCSCVPPNVTVSYCQSDIVAHVTVQNVTKNDSDPIHGADYGVEYVKVYRKTKKYEKVEEKNVMRTPPIGGACGVAIDVKSKDKDWVIFGTVGRRQIFFNICSPSAKWTKDFQKQLDSLAKTNCTGVVHRFKNFHFRSNSTDSTNHTTSAPKKG